MGKVVRADKAGVQKLRAKEIVPGDIVEVSGEMVGGEAPKGTKISPPTIYFCCIDFFFK